MVYFQLTREILKQKGIVSSLTFEDFESEFWIFQI
jgi:hypothetical protein